jgi:hypothetical protein
MGDGRRRGKRRSGGERSAPIPLEPVDLLVGLAPDVELLADDLPPGIDPETPAGAPSPASTTVAEAGKLIRAGEGTIRRLIRTRVLRPGDGSPVDGDDVDRAGVPPRTPDKPGE